ncbi:MAG: hypothetical protein HY791_01510 [Deltaproteobacteria bacterium]|nr:hypothetical protein [Deltaproteobacteria bacterium]
MSDEHKKAVVKTLLGALQASPVAKAVDSKAFIMAVHNSFDAMYANGTIDLDPLWAQLSPQGIDPDVAALFFKFEADLSKIPLKVKAPRALANLPPDQRRKLAGGRPASVAAPAAATPALSDVESQILVMLSTALRACPAGARISTGQLQAVVSSNYKSLFDGQTFKFDPVLEWLLAQPNVNEFDVYPGIVKFNHLLQERGLRMIEPRLKLSSAERAKSLAQAEPEHAKRPASTTTAPSQPNQVAAPTKPDAKKDRKIALLISFIAISLVCGALAFVMRPARPFDIVPLKGVFPIASGELVNGKLFGVLDEPAWKALPPEKKAEAVKALEALLRQSGQLKAGVTIRNGARKWVVFDVKGEKLSVEE